MTRFVYGGGGDAEVVDTSGHPRANAPAAVYSSRVGGAGVTDILSMAGTALAGTVTTDAFGQAIFQGPNGYTATLWLDFGTGPRWGVSPKQIDQPNAGGQLIADQRTLDYSGRTASTKAAIPTNASDPLLAALVAAIDPLVIPRFPSSATRDAAFPAPADGDRVFRTDRHLGQTYNGGVGRWVMDAGLIGEVILGNSTTNAVTFSSIPQEYNNLRIEITGRCAASSQASKYGVETFIQYNADSNIANYTLNGWVQLDKQVSAVTTYGISVVDASGGSTTSVAPAPVSKAALSGDLGTRLGFMAGESTPSNTWTLAEVLVPDYTNARPHSHRATSFGSCGSPTAYYLSSEYRGTWLTSAAITSCTVALRTGALFAAGSTFRLYGF